MNDIQKDIWGCVKKIFSIDFSINDIEIKRSEKKVFGDFSSNISFKLAKKIGKKPEEIADILKNHLEKNQKYKKIEAVNGFINFFLKRENYYEALKKILKEGKNFGNSNLFKNKKIQVEFISANPTGPLTLANGRGGFGGDVLSRIFQKAGAKVTREYYINDSGNQIKILGESILVSSGLLKNKDNIYKGEYINNWAKKHQKECQRLKDNPFKLGQLAAKDILDNLIKPQVKKMGIKFDKWFSERTLFYKKIIEKILAILKKKNLIYEKEGALWFKAKKFGDLKDWVLRKSTGEYTYFATDIAYHWNKFQERKFDKVINFWGADHHGYVNRLQAAVKALGFSGKLDIIIMQMVRLIKEGREFRMSKRKGAYVTIDNLFKLIGKKEKEASDVARFFFLSRAFSTHMDFDLDLARKHSEKNPVFYVKYAYARISGILRRANKKYKGKNTKLELLTQPEEIDLIESLLNLEWVIESILQDKSYPVHFLTFYAREIAEKFHNFYEKCRVIDEKNLELTSARLKLVEATKIVLGIVMRDLLGIEAPEKI